MTTRKKINRLEKLRHIKDRLKEEAKVRVSDQRQKEALLEKQSEVLETRLERNISLFRERSSGGIITPDELWCLRLDIDSIEEEIREIGEAMEKTRREMNILQEDLISKNRETRLTEALLEVHKCERRREIIDCEQKELDDLVCMKFTK
jgi:flagellar export protein FliJ